jgi:hypothetical protein
LSTNPGLTPAQVEQIMEETALPMANSAVSGAGLVQVNPAVAAAEALLTSVVIQTDGSTSLAEVGSNYFLFAAGGTSGPELQYFGAPMVIGAGQFNGWAAIGAVQTSSGYDVAWKDVATDQYAVWTTDSSGNFTGSTGAVAGNSIALETYETTFHQDLNGDGTIGIVATVFHTNGSTSLAEVGDNYFLFAAGGTSGPELQYFGAPVVAGAGQFNGWTPIGAVQTSSGYDVAWKDAGTGQYAVWTTDSGGNFTGSTGAVAGTSTALETYETAFQQDLNGDGTIGIPAASGSSGHSSVDVSRSISVKVINSDTFFFEPGSGASGAADAGGAPTMEHPAWVTAHPSADPLHNEQTSQWLAQFHSMTGGHDTITPENHDGTAAAHFHVTDPHAGHFIIG